MVDLSAAITQPLQLSVATENSVQADVLRLDCIDPVISGNKWFKLKHYLSYAVENGLQTLLSFGGAWSNHLVATAAAAKKLELNSIGIIRGEQPALLSASLETASSLGMKLVFVSREVYSQKDQPPFTENLLKEYGPLCIIPEGGAGPLGIQGAAEILYLAKEPTFYSHIICAIGTGTLITGLAASSNGTQQIVGIPVLKGFDKWRPDRPEEEWQHRLTVLAGYHRGGYAKKDSALLQFMNSFYMQTGIPTDFVYTGKMFFALADLIKKKYFSPGSRILAIHSGGLQGNQSLPPDTLVF